MKSFKKKKSPGIDNIPGELVQAEGDAVISALHKISKNMADRRVASLRSADAFPVVASLPPKNSE